jgi:formate dehydrogenase subunit gamma
MPSANAHIKNMLDTQPSLDEVLALIRPLQDRPGPLLEVLHAVQGAFGFIPPTSVPVIANALNLSRAEVHGVISFYHYFRERPAGHHVVQVCRAESCQAMQGEQLAQHAEHRMGLRFGETSADGKRSLEPVFCLGLCSLSPAIMIDSAVHGRVTPERFDELLAQAEAS